ncbi:hypothetical protein [Pseudomonas fluorescens]|uniref:hypothetical protein n=1 Tax=Pseudomonas fluorescens TaxID=294 RepID=UPI00058A78D2|nr:hypothetical protein [Pseudomonas fluorescens]CEL31212.1 hypothetical protein SRM1_04576 [Pseudomonas fluorescens]
MREIEYKLYESDEDCAWVIEQCLKNCEVHLGFAFIESSQLCRTFLVKIDGEGYIFPRSVARALTWIYVEAVDCNVVDKFHDVFLQVIHLFQSTMNYDNFDEKLVCVCKDLISNFRVQANAARENV